MNSTLIFRIIQALIFVAFIANRAYYTRKYPPQEEETLEKSKTNLITRISNLLSIVALISLVGYLVSPKFMNWASLPLPDWARWIGVLLTVIGFALLQWSHAALGKNWSDQPRIMEGQILVSDGPYRWIRHPIYSAFIAILGSTLLITANWFVGGLWLFITIVDILSRIKFEEEKMLQQFGDEYHSYLQRTGALFPRIQTSKKN